MTEPSPVADADALDDLVAQFSDPLSFYRELIQNAVDAGSPAVDVRLELGEVDAADHAVMTIHVDDFGEGMDRAIIDGRLTRLFSSGKDGDLTKIGRFGIGFVSVFAIGPDAVCLDTARGGESWRVLFEADRSFSRISRDEPVDGTHIRIIKRIPAADYEGFVERSREVLIYWCKHVDAEITFQDELVSRPLDLAETTLPCTARLDEAGTVAIAGHTTDGSSFYGFYNKGLTLLEGTDERFHPGVAFKVSSRYLEHTLTRDNVLRDAAFERAMSLLAELVERRLPVALFDAIDAAVRAGEVPRPELCVVAQRLVARGADLPDAVGARALCATPDGSPLTLAAIRGARERGCLLHVSDAAWPVGGALAAARDRWPVAVVAEASPSFALLAAFPGPELRRADEVFCLPEPAAEPDVAAWAPLTGPVRALLQAHGARVAGVAVARFDYAGSSIADRVAVAQAEPGALTAVAEARELGRALWSRRRWVTLNAEHATARHLRDVSRQGEPELAAYLLAKLFFLDEALDGELDGALAAVALEQRRDRLARSAA